MITEMTNSIDKLKNKMDMANSQIRNLGGKKRVKSLITLLKNERKEIYEKKLRNGRLQHTHCCTNSSGLGCGLTNLQNNRFCSAPHLLSFKNSG